MPKPRALIYVRGTADQVDQQLPHVTAVCERRGYQVAGIIREQPGATARWHEANRMLGAGDADVIVIASATVIPDVLESATGALRGPLTRTAGAHRKGRRRRIRPVRRGGEA